MREVRDMTFLRSWGAEVGDNMCMPQAPFLLLPTRTYLAEHLHCRFNKIYSASHSTADDSRV